VGGKNASLGEMYRELRNNGIKIPNGFAVTAKYTTGFSCLSLKKGGGYQ